MKGLLISILHSHSRLSSISLSNSCLSPGLSAGYFLSYFDSLSSCAFALILLPHTYYLLLVWAVLLPVACTLVILCEHMLSQSSLSCVLGACLSLCFCWSVAIKLFFQFYAFCSQSCTLGSITEATQQILIFLKSHLHDNHNVDDSLKLGCLTFVCLFSQCRLFELWSHFKPTA